MTEEVMNEDVKLDLQDLAGAVRIIDIAIERGAIKGEEASVVGKIRDNLVTFVKAHVPASEESEEAPAEQAE
jgi:hypothetical protein